MPTIKEMYKYIDLYGSANILIALQNQYKAVAYTNKSIPGGGSPARSSKDISLTLKISKLIFHRNNEVTAITNNGNLRFF